MARPFALRHLYALMRSAVNEGDFPPREGGEPVAFSEEDAIAFFGANRTETREALSRLADEGILVRAPRRGTTVAFKPVGWSLAGGLVRPVRHGVEIDEVGEPARMAATSALQTAFGQKVDELCFRDELFLVDGVRVCLRTSYWVGDLPGRTVILPTSEVPLTTSFADAYGVAYGRLSSTVTAVTADRRQADVLQVALHEPLLWRRTVITDESGVIREISHSFYVAARVFFDLEDRIAGAAGI